MTEAADLVELLYNAEAAGMSPDDFGDMLQLAERTPAPTINLPTQTFDMFDRPWRGAVLEPGSQRHMNGTYLGVYKGRGLMVWRKESGR